MEISKSKLFKTAGVLFMSLSCLVGCSNGSRLESTAIEVGLDYLSLENGKKVDLLSYSNNVVNVEKVQKDFDNRFNDLVSLDETYLDIDDFYTKYYTENNDIFIEDYTSITDAEDTGEKYYNPKEDLSLSTELDLIDDSRIIEVDGKKVIKNSDLNVDNGNIDVVNYKVVAIPISYDEITETYDRMKKNPKYNYKYVNHKYDKSKKCIDIKYTSLIDKEYIKIIRVELKGGKINNIGYKGE